MKKYELPTSILGKDFISAEDVQKYLKGIVYTDEQIVVLAESLPSEDVLNWCKGNDYALIPAPPIAMSFLDIRGIQSSQFSSSDKNRWYSNEEFACEDKTSFGWLAIKKTPIPESIGKTWYAQEKLVTEIERVPDVAEMAWFITTYFKVRGIWLFEHTGVRTLSLGSVGDHVDIGRYNEKSKDISVHCYWDKEYLPDLGLSVARILLSNT